MGIWGKEQMISVQPPYLTAQFQRCPMAWYLGEKWNVKGSDKHTAKLIGTAVTVGLERHFSGFQDGEQRVRDTVEANNLEGSDRTLEEVLSLSVKGFLLGQVTNLDYKEILGVEMSFARARPDLVLRMADNSVVPVDHKVKIQLDPKYLGAECRKYDVDTQMFHYSMAVGEYYGVHVSRVLVHFIILGPRGRTMLHPVLISPERLAYWRSGAEEAWQSMHEIEHWGLKPAPRFTGCNTVYGQCDFYEACHSLGCDEELMKLLYEKRYKRWN